MGSKGGEGLRLCLLMGLGLGLLNGTEGVSEGIVARRLFRLLLCAPTVGPKGIDRGSISCLLLLLLLLLGAEGVCGCAIGSAVGVLLLLLLAVVGIGKIAGGAVHDHKVIVVVGSGGGLVRSEHFRGGGGCFDSRLELILVAAGRCGS